jgi:hypothetical protein
MASSKGTVRTIHRDSVSGRIVTEKYAETHPRTTETERVRIPPPSPKKDK